MVIIIKFLKFSNRKALVSQLIQLRQKIKGIKTTRKITHAVRLVSMSLYAKLERRHTPLKAYITTLKKFFKELLSRAPLWKHPIFTPKDILDSKPLYIVIATSKGLCGSLNSNFLRYFEDTFTPEKEQNPYFITIGKKATKFVQEQGFKNIICNYAELSSNNYASVASDLLDKITDRSFKFSSVTFYSSYLKSFFAQRPRKTTLIPFLLDELEGKKQTVTDETPKKEEDDDDELIWEQKKFKTLDHLALFYVRERIITLLYQSLLAEQAARFIAMDGSTSNADKIIEKLTLQYNKQRQALITREVSELSATTTT